MSTQEQRGYQMFPVLDAARVETALRFASGPERRFAPGEIVYDHGQRDAPSWLVLSGSVDITRRDGLDRKAPIVTFGPGQFTGEVNQLAGRPAITSARAGEQAPLRSLSTQRTCAR
jgi:thioredoxin reductase (NADPH)